MYIIYIIYIDIHILLDSILHKKMCLFWGRMLRFRTFEVVTGAGLVLPPTVEFLTRLEAPAAPKMGVVGTYVTTI